MESSRAEKTPVSSSFTSEHLSDAGPFRHVLIEMVFIVAAYRFASCGVPVYGHLPVWAPQLAGEWSIDVWSVLKVD